MSKDHDAVNHPKHYTSHPARCACGAGIECIQITEHMSFNLGNALKYIWRADLKGDAIEDLKKARWYIERELEKREGKPANSATTASDAFDDASWSEWRGGARPVGKGIFVEVRFRDGHYGRGKAIDFWWSHGGNHMDIMHYRVVEQKDDSAAPDVEGWIEWEGGEQPVPYHTVVEVLSRGGVLGRAIAGKLNWLHLRDMSDIVRYRIAKTY